MDDRIVYLFFSHIPGLIREIRLFAISFDCSHRKMAKTNFQSLPAVDGMKG